MCQFKRLIIKIKKQGEFKYIKRLIKPFIFLIFSTSIRIVEFKLIYIERLIFMSQPHQFPNI